MNDTALPVLDLRSSFEIALAVVVGGSMKIFLISCCLFCVSIWYACDSSILVGVVVLGAILFHGSWEFSCCAQMSLWSVESNTRPLLFGTQSCSSGADGVCW